ncbi:hypothetical protein [Xanthomonas sp. NCPPB 2632]|uniref:hypothetical protein n=1 Tax=Xanthomonas sp. NCPPB 2632 TaxID=3240912 RepID=UPI003519C908
MKTLAPVLCIAFLASASASTLLHAEDTPQPMSLGDLVSGAIPLIPGTAAPMQRYLHARSDAPTHGRTGWQYPAIGYRTKEGALLRITLIADGDNPAPPPVVRVLAAIDASGCVDGSGLRNDLTSKRGIRWTALSSNDGWTATDSGKYLTISQMGHCVTSVIIDVRRQPRVGPAARPLRVDASGHVTQIPLPHH